MAQKRVVKATSQEAGISMFAESFWREHGERNLSDLYLTLGGLGDEIQNEHPLVVAEQIALAVEASVQKMSDKRAEPIPSDIMAMLRLVEYFCRTDGDVYQSVAIPAEVIVKEVAVECADEGAKKFWQELWLEHLDIFECYEQIYWGTEKDGQAFPLLVWDKSNLEGIAFCEPTSVWVGSHISHTHPNTSLLLPDSFPLEKFKDMVHPLAYNSFVTDQNVQTTNAQRVEIKPDCMIPVFAHKQKWMRYAIPHIARASRNIMHRQILEEYRRGTIEKFMSQMWLFTVGDSNHPASPTKVKNIRNLISLAAKNRSNALVVDHLVKVENISPKTLDELLGNETFASVRQMIFADLGYSIFLLSGEVPGTSGRGGGQQVETDLQLTLERWEKHPRRFKKWAMEVSKLVAAKEKSKALKKALPNFVVQMVGIKQMLAIKERVVPYMTSGKLSTQTALKEGGYDYSKELANKKQEEKDKDLFLPPPSFNQMTTGNDGTNESSTSKNGRPTLAENPNQKRTRVEAELEVYANADDFESEIDRRFRENLTTPDAFVAWLITQLEIEMLRAYQDGYRDWGGRGSLDAGLLFAAPQGSMFQQNCAQMFREDLNAKLESGQAVMTERTRALQYAESVNYAYVLGVQEAMREHGATGWQRVLHPELSLSGPCAQCQEDSNVIHEMTEPFFEFHPGGVCGVQSVRYTVADKTANVRVPDFTRRVIRRI